VLVVGRLVLQLQQQRSDPLFSLILPAASQSAISNFKQRKKPLSTKTKGKTVPPTISYRIVARFLFSFAKY
jgi:hypothetical protein